MSGQRGGEVALRVHKTAAIVFLCLAWLGNSAQAAITGKFDAERINGLEREIKLLPAQPFEFCVRPIEYYSFSGRRGERFAAPVTILSAERGAQRSRAAVGLDGRNQPADVSDV